MPNDSKALALSECLEYLSSLLHNYRCNEDNDACWIWTRKLKKGYAYISTRIGGRQGKYYDFKVSRLIAHLVFDLDLSSDKQVLHKCNNKSCWNPRHLYLGTHLDNMIDLANSNVLKGQGHHNFGKLKTRCIHGHELIESNLYYDYKGRRYCKTCVSERGKLRYLKSKEKENLGAYAELD